MFFCVRLKTVQVSSYFKALQTKWYLLFPLIHPTSYMAMGKEQSFRDYAEVAAAEKAKSGIVDIVIICH